MDFEYLEHLKGSPYIKEGIWDRFKAKAAQQMGSLGAMAGHQIQKDPHMPQLLSLWGGFIKSLKSIMRDWSDQVSPMFGPEIPLDENDQQIKDALDELARLMVPMDPHKIGKYYQDLGYQDPTTRVQRHNPESFVKGSAYNRSTTSPAPSLKSLAPKAPASYDIEEGFWDAANRDLKLNKALGSNNPKQILAAYKKYVMSLFLNFMRDAVKSTKLNPKQVNDLLKKAQPEQPGWQPAANAQKILQQLAYLHTAGGETPETAAANAQAAAQQGQPAQQPQQTQPSKAGQPAQGQPGAAQGGVGGSGISPNDYPWVVLKAIEIIIDAVRSDVGHSGKFFDVPTLPTSYPTDIQLTKPTNIKEIHSDPRGSKEDVPDKPETGEKEAEPEYKGEFLYNFHSKFNKYPGTHFAIEVKPVTVSPYLDKGPYAKDKDLEGPIAKPKVEVWWNCEDTKNQIYVQTDLNGKKSQPFLLMQFFDQEVDSQAGATTPGHTNLFSTEKLLKSASQMGGIDKSQMIKPVVSEIKALEPTLLRALMATVTRKSMEFKKKSKRAFPIKFDNAGNVKFFNKETGVEDTIDPEGIKEKLSGPDAAAWNDSLEHYGYYEQFPEMKPKTEKDYPAYGDAVDKVIQKGAEQKTAESSVAKAWLKMRPYKIDNLDTITADQLFSVAIGEMTPEEAISPVLNDAKLALEALNIKGEEAVKYLAPAWNELKKTKPENTITKGELESLVKGALKKKPEATTPTPTPPAAAAAPAPAPVSKPASGTPPTSPVSSTPSGPASAPPPTSPVSTTPSAPATPAPAPAAAPKKKKEKQPIKIWKSDDGSLAWSNFKGEHGALNSKTMAKLKAKYPKEFATALAHAKANKFKDPMANEPEKPEGEKKPLKELLELADEVDLSNKRVNPFQLDNFL